MCSDSTSSDNLASHQPTWLTACILSIGKNDANERGKRFTEILATHFGFYTASAGSGHSLGHSLNGESRAARVPSLACLQLPSPRKARAQLPAFPKSTG